MQSGTFSELVGEIEQTGSMNIAELTQAGGENTHLAFSIRQSGTGNVATVVQSVGPKATKAQA
jgi:hypothetical protein